MVEPSYRPFSYIVLSSVRLFSNRLEFSKMPAVQGVPKATEAKPKEKKPRAPKAAKEKKPKGSKSSAPSHPPYFQMIKEAVLALKEKTGSSPYAIAKYMEEKHKGVLPANYKKMLAIQLKNFAAKGKLVKVKASFKLSEAGKKEGKPAAKEKKPAKAAPSAGTKRKAPAAAAAAKKTVASSKVPKKAKKAAGVKKAKKAAPAKPKQRKSIKSPAAKRAKKAAA
ncbi:histone H1 [Elaeis guineensis]|uniref:Histone H1 n=1 Tax=Elaeis guineensis var. tenera TaxID=51953 RepID=A0A6I9RX10_ELAGV|nr:histone H1 [Elaeis guineensis]